MRAKRMAIGDNYYNGSQYCWPPAACGNQIDGTSSSCWPNCNTDLVVEGNVGIGTTNPSAGGEQDLKLDVEGAVGAKFYCDENGNNCAGAPLGGGGSGPLVQAGQVVTDASEQIFTVDFPLYYSSPPIVTVSSQSSIGGRPNAHLHHIEIVDITTTGVSFWREGHNGSTPGMINWIAVGE